MTEQDLVKGLTYLGSAYGKEYNKMECEQHYDFLNEYSYETFVKAIKNIIKKSKFLPKISELVEECEECKEQVRFEVIEFMKTKGYFKDIREYEKTMMWYSKGIIPSWLKEDLNKYYKMMQQDKLQYQEQKLIGG